MKIQIKEESTKEIEFPVPSFWSHFSIKYMVTEKDVIWTSGTAIVVNDLSRIQDVLRDDYKRISEDEFFEQYNKAQAVINEAIQMPEIA